jgi:hypothetical protein
LQDRREWIVIRVFICGATLDEKADFRGAGSQPASVAPLGGFSFAMKPKGSSANDPC